MNASLETQGLFPTFQSPLPVGRATGYPGHLPRGHGPQERQTGHNGACTEAGCNLVPESHQSPSFSFLEALFLDRNQVKRWSLWSFCPVQRLQPTTSPSSPSSCLSPQFTSCSPLPSIQLTTLLLPPPQPNGYQMHCVDLGQSGEENTQTNQQRKHN